MAPSRCLVVKAPFYTNSYTSLGVSVLGLITAVIMAIDQRKRKRQPEEPIPPPLPEPPLPLPPLPKVRPPPDHTLFHHSSTNLMADQLMNSAFHALGQRPTFISASDLSTNPEPPLRGYLFGTEQYFFTANVSMHSNKWNLDNQVASGYFTMNRTTSDLSAADKWKFSAEEPGRYVNFSDKMWLHVQYLRRHKTHGKRAASTFMYVTFSQRECDSHTETSALSWVEQACIWLREQNTPFLLVGNFRVHSWNAMTDYYFPTYIAPFKGMTWDVSVNDTKGVGSTDGFIIHPSLYKYVEYKVEPLMGVSTHHHALILYMWIDFPPDVQQQRLYGTNDDDDDHTPPPICKSITSITT